MGEVPQKGQDRHALIIELMSGKLGKLFTGTLLSEQSGEKPIQLTSYVALYVDEDGNQEVVFVQLESDNRNSRTASRELQQHSLQPGQVPGAFMRLLHTDSFETSMKVEQEADQLALTHAKSLLRGYDLPVVYGAFCRSLSSGTEQVLLCYPIMAHADRLLRVLKDTAARRFGG